MDNQTRAAALQEELVDINEVLAEEQRKVQVAEQTKRKAEEDLERSKTKISTLGKLRGDMDTLENTFARVKRHFAAVIRRVSAGSDYDGASVEAIKMSIAAIEALLPSQIDRSGTPPHINQQVEQPPVLQQGRSNDLNTNHGATGVAIAQQHALSTRVFAGLVGNNLAFQINGMVTGNTDLQTRQGVIDAGQGIGTRQEQQLLPESVEDPNEEAEMMLMVARSPGRNIPQRTQTLLDSFNKDFEENPRDYDWKQYYYHKKIGIRQENDKMGFALTRIVVLEENTYNVSGIWDHNIPAYIKEDTLQLYVNKPGVILGHPRVLAPWKILSSAAPLRDLHRQTIVAAGKRRGKVAAYCLPTDVSSGRIPYIILLMKSDRRFSLCQDSNVPEPQLSLGGYQFQKIGLFRKTGSHEGYERLKDLEQAGFDYIGPGNLQEEENDVEQHAVGEESKEEEEEPLQPRRPPHVDGAYAEESEGQMPRSGRHAVDNTVDDEEIADVATAPLSVQQRPQPEAWRLTEAQIQAIHDTARRMQGI